MVENLTIIIVKSIARRRDPMEPSIYTYLQYTHLQKSDPTGMDFRVELGVADPKAIEDEMLERGV
jgi:hypothetical protein